MRRYALRSELVVLLGLALLATVACGGRRESTGTEERQTGEASSLLPEEHPSLTPSSDMSLPPVAPTAGTGDAGLTWGVPEGWSEETPSSSMRRAQYRLPSETGDGQCVVFYFGPGEGGDVEANVMRWADEFGQPDGRSSRDADGATRNWQANECPSDDSSEVTGVHSGGMSPMTGGGQKKEGQMLLGAIASGPDANWFFKCTGPEATMRAEAKRFRGDDAVDPEWYRS